MTADEIIAAVNDDHIIQIPAGYAAEFMQECEKHNLNCNVYMSISGGTCVISKQRVEVEDSGGEKWISIIFAGR